MRNAYILMILQALLTLLLFFSEGYVRYTTIGLFLLVDLVLLIGLLTKKWSFEELLTFAALLCSGVFMLFYMFARSGITMIFGVALMLLFLVIAMLSILSRSDVSDSDGSESIVKLGSIQKPEEPPYYYDVEYEPYYNATVQAKAQMRETKTESLVPDYQKHEKYDSFQSVKPEPVMHIKHDRHDVYDHKASQTKDKLAAKAVLYELEREAQQLRDADRKMRKIEVYDAEKELLRETDELEAAQKQIDAVKNAAKAAKATKELNREAREILKVQKQLSDIKKAQDDIKKAQDLEKEVKTLKKAEKQIQEIQFLDKQEKIVKQARDIAKAQKEIDEMTKKTRKSVSGSLNPKKSAPVQASSHAKVKKVPEVKASKAIKIVKALEESFYFATDNGDKFHEPGCLAIKKVPKNKLTLYTSRKDAMKKGLKPCNVCIPR